MLELENERIEKRDTNFGLRKEVGVLDSDEEEEIEDPDDVIRKQEVNQIKRPWYLINRDGFFAILLKILFYISTWLSIYVTPLFLVF